MLALTREHSAPPQLPRLRDYTEVWSAFSSIHSGVSTYAFGAEWAMPLCPSRCAIQTCRPTRAPGPVAIASVRMEGGIPDLLGPGKEHYAHSVVRSEVVTSVPPPCGPRSNGGHTFCVLLAVTSLPTALFVHALAFPCSMNTVLSLLPYTQPHTVDGSDFRSM